MSELLTVNEIVTRAREWLNRDNPHFFYKHMLRARLGIFGYDYDEDTGASRLSGAIAKLKRDRIIRYRPSYKQWEYLDHRVTRAT